MKCAGCGKRLAGEESFSPACGAKIESAASLASESKLNSPQRSPVWGRRAGKRAVWLGLSCFLLLTLAAWALWTKRQPSNSDVATAIEWFYNGAGFTDCGPNKHQPFKVDNVLITQIEKTGVRRFHIWVDYDVLPTADVHVPQVDEIAWILKAKATDLNTAREEMDRAGKTEVGCNLTRFLLLAPYMNRKVENISGKTGVISRAGTRYRLRNQRFEIDSTTSHDGKYLVRDRGIIHVVKGARDGDQISIEEN
jgi:hypothetical protein